MSNRDIMRLIVDSAGAAISGAKTATFSSEALDLKDYDDFGIILDLGTVSGTSPTLNIKVQMSMDGGTTWLDTYPAAKNSETQAALAEITATKETAEFWENWLTIEGSGVIDPRVKFVFTIAGTSPSFAVTNVWVVMKNRGRD